MSAWRTMADAGRTRLQTLPHDTFRGRVCRCPVVGGVQFVGDGYTQCEASGALHCEINNGGCWKKTQNGKTYSACVVRNYMVINSVTAPQDSREMESKLAKRYMDSEIRAIMVQYMPLDNHGEPANHLLRRNI